MMYSPRPPVPTNLSGGLTAARLSELGLATTLHTLTPTPSTTTTAYTTTDPNANPSPTNPNPISKIIPFPNVSNVSKPPSPKITSSRNPHTQPKAKDLYRPGEGFAQNSTRVHEKGIRPSGSDEKGLRSGSKKKRKRRNRWNCTGLRTSAAATQFHLQCCGGQRGRNSISLIYFLTSFV